MAVETTSTSDAPGLSRRRLVQGALWATPAVLIATAAPAAAASPPVLGGIIITSPTGFQNTSVLTVSKYVTYVGQGGAHPDHPVSNVKVVITVPNARLVAGNGTTTSAGWSPTAVRVNGATTTTFTYTWNGAPLSGSNTATSQLVALIPKTATRSAFDVTVQATGTSNLVGVSTSPNTVTIAAYAVLTLPSGLTSTRDPFLTSPRYSHHVAPVLNSSAAPSAPVVGLVARITLPTAAVATGTPSATAGSWTYAGSTVNAPNTTIAFTYTPGTLNPSATATPATFRIPFPAFLLDTPTVTITFEGHSPTAAAPLTTISTTDTLGL